MKSLRARLLLAYAGLILLGFAGLALFAGSQISSSTVADFDNRLAEQAQLIARALKDPLEHALEGETSAGTLADMLQSYSDQTGYGVALLEGNGRYWLGNSVSGTLPSAANLEISAALRGQTTTDTRSTDGLAITYAAAPVREDEHLIGIIWLSAPASVAQSLVTERWVGLGAGVLALTVGAVLASLWLSASLARPLTQLRQTALHIAEGDFSQRLPENRRDEIGMLAHAFNHMAQQVEAMLAEQRAFASNASHELRTPLTTIRLRSEALRDGLVDEETARQYIAEIDDEAARLGNLIQDLILLSRLDAGRMDRGEEKIAPVRLAQSILQEFDAQATAQGVTLSLEADENLPPLVASLSHLKIVFRNLIGNALKYTPANGRIHWQMRVEGDWLLSTIRDTGQGIASADLAHVFERFYRADKARGREVPGTGLGLALVKTIVDAYGGSVTIDSAGAGSGTTVTVRWPLT